MKGNNLLFYLFYMQIHVSRKIYHEIITYANKKHQQSYMFSASGVLFGISIIKYLMNKLSISECLMNKLSISEANDKLFYLVLLCVFIAEPSGASMLILWLATYSQVCQIKELVAN